MITLELEHAKVGMEVEALSTRREGRRWLPARVVSINDALEIIGVQCYSSDGARHPTVYRRPSQLRLKPAARAPRKR